MSVESWGLNDPLSSELFCPIKKEVPLLLNQLCGSLSPNFMGEKYSKY